MRETAQEVRTLADALDTIADRTAGRMDPEALLARLAKRAVAEGRLTAPITAEELAEVTAAQAEAEWDRRLAEAVEDRLRVALVRFTGLAQASATRAALEAQEVLQRHDGPSLAEARAQASRERREAEAGIPPEGTLRPDWTAPGEAKWQLMRDVLVSHVQELRTRAVRLREADPAKPADRAWLVREARQECRSAEVTHGGA